MLDKKFRVEAIYSQTGRKRTVELEAYDLDELYKKLDEKGFIAPFSVAEVVPDSPTVAQIKYAEVLKIKIPDNCTRSDLSALITRQEEGDIQDPSIDLKEFAMGRRIKFNNYCGKKRLYNIVFDSLDSPHKEAFFVFSVYRSTR